MSRGAKEDQPESKGIFQTAKEYWLGPSKPKATKPSEPKKQDATEKVVGDVKSRAKALSEIPD